MANYTHFAYKANYRNPTGGVKLGSPLELMLKVEAVSTPLESVSLILTKDGESPVPYPMCPTKDGYSVIINISSFGLYFYHFEAIFSDGNRERIGRNEYYSAEKNSTTDWELVVFTKISQNTNSKEESNLLGGGVIYQIFPDRFNIGGKRLKTKSYAKYREDWYGIPDFTPPITNTDFFGGNIRGIIEKLPYLNELGVTAIYLNPIFEARSNHKYDTGNYLRIDSDFGSEDDLKELIRQAAELGIGIILDGVFSHTGDDSIYFNKYGNYDSVGAYMSKDSPYYEWYTFTNFPKSYASWWGIDTLPNVNEDNKHYTEFICGVEGVLRHYTRLGLAGWRLDVADELPDSFLDNLNFAVKRENANAVIIGEVWENAATKTAYNERRRYFSTSQLDSVTNYPLRNAIIDFVALKGIKKLHCVILELISTYPTHVLNNLMNVLGTHDTERIRTILSSSSPPKTREQRALATDTDADTISRVKLAATLQFTLPGIPSVYYGDEAGMEGYEDPFNRRCYPWGRENTELVEYYKKLGKIRSSYRELLSLATTEIIIATDNLIIFEREYKKEKLTIALNVTTQTQTLDEYKSKQNKTQALYEYKSKQNKTQALDEYKGKQDLITNKVFTGKLDPQSAIILKA